MDQKGVKMNHLWIKQVSGIIFILKIIFFINFTHFNNLSAANTIYQKLRV
jgi:succinate dehydrogenase hydrophobic anchor subunit